MTLNYYKVSYIKITYIPFHQCHPCNVSLHHTTGQEYNSYCPYKESNLMFHYSSLKQNNPIMLFSLLFIVQFEL